MRPIRNDTRILRIMTQSVILIIALEQSALAGKLSVEETAQSNPGSTKTLKVENDSDKSHSIESESSGSTDTPTSSQSHSNNLNKPKHFLIKRYPRVHFKTDAGVALKSYYHHHFNENEKLSSHHNGDIITDGLILGPIVRAAVLSAGEIVCAASWTDRGEEKTKAEYALGIALCPVRVAGQWGVGALHTAASYTCPTVMAVGVVGAAAANIICLLGKPAYQQYKLYKDLREESIAATAQKKLELTPESSPSKYLKSPQAGSAL